MKPISDTKIFVEAGVNRDVDPRFLKPNEYISLWNTLVNVSESMGRAVNMKGTVNVFELPINAGFTLPSAHMVCVGACEDIERNAIIYFLAEYTAPSPDTDAVTINPPPVVFLHHSIMRMYVGNFRCEWILKSQPVLNFKPDHKVSAGVIGQQLFGTDGYEDQSNPFTYFNPPWEINLLRACGYTNRYLAGTPYYVGHIIGDGGKVYECVKDHTSAHATNDTAYWKLVNKRHYTSINLNIIDRIKKPPTTELAVAYGNDIDRKENALRTKLFQFRYRYVYDDNQASVWSCVSEMPLPQGDELLSGNFIRESTVNNYISVAGNTGPENVYSIEFAVREGNFGVWRTIKKVQKYLDNGTALVNDSIYTFNFYNDIWGDVIDQKDVNRLQDYVPQTSKAMTILEKARIGDLNYKEGFDNPNLDVAITRTQQKIDILEQLHELPVTVGTQVGIDTALFATFPNIIDDYTVISIGIYRYTRLINGPPAPGYGDVTGAELHEIQILKMPGESTPFLVARMREVINARVASLWSCYHYPVQYMAYHGVTNNLLVIDYESVLRHDHGLSLADEYFVNKLVVKLYSSIPKYTHWKSGCVQFLGVQYYDRALRSAGAVISDDTRVDIPYLPTGHGAGSMPDYGEVTLDRNILSWTINHQPPAWAHYWRWVYGGSSLSYYLDFNVIANKIFDDGANTYIEFNNQIQESVKSIRGFNIRNYVWQKGDRVRFLSREMTPDTDIQVYINAVADYEILDQVIGPEYIYDSGTGTWSMVNFYDGWYKKDDSSTPAFVTDSSGNKTPLDYKMKLVIQKLNKSELLIANGLSSANDIIVEVYRPSKKGEDAGSMVYHEIDKLRPVLHAGTSLRAHSKGDGAASTDQQFNPDGSLVAPATGTFLNGDSYLKARIAKGGTYLVEADNWSDFYESSFISIGRPTTVIDAMRRTWFKARMIYSGKLIQDSLINDTSKVDETDNVSLSEVFGPLYYAFESGFTLKLLQANKPTSIYVGREGLKQATVANNEIIALSKDTLAASVPSEDDFGTIFTEGVLKHNRLSYYYDIYNGCIIRDDANGGSSISAFGIDNDIKNLSIKLLESGVENINVYAGYNGRYDLIVFSFVDRVNPVNNLTVAWHETSKKWSFINIVPDYLIGHGQIFTSFSGNKLWVHDINEKRCFFYDQKYPQIIRLAGNKSPKGSKVWKSLGIASNKRWDITEVSVAPNDNYPLGMISKIPAAWFRSLQGKFWSAFGKNMKTNTATVSRFDLLNGIELRGPAIEIQMENLEDGQVDLFEVTVNGITSQRNEI